MLEICKSKIMDNQLFARCFVATACEKGVQEYGSIMGYAKKIWPDKLEKTAAQTLYAIVRKSNKTGRPQSVPLELAVFMVSLLPGIESFASFCFTVEQKVLSGWSMANYNAFLETIEAKRKKPTDASVIPTQDQGTHVHGAADQG